jgi:signal transduction histidine kinase/CheY-like chemotaxis protein
MAPITVELRGHTLRVSVSPLKNPHGEGSALIIASDMSDLVAADIERESLVDQLHAADKMRSLGQLTAGVAHEINNPLAALLPNLQLLRDYHEKIIGSLDEASLKQMTRDPELSFVLNEIPELLSDTVAAGKQIKTVVGEMLRYAHPGSERGERTKLPELLDDALSLLSRKVRFNTRIEREYEPTPELVLDRGLISQAILNIAINASQAIADSSGEDRWIRIRTYQRDDGVAIEVSNSGPAIPKEIAKDIFAPFFTTKDPGAGVGLGLSIAYETVRRHGGVLEVLDGLPTTFRIWLPNDTGKALSSARPPMAAPEQAAPARVLVVDDEHLVRKGLRRVLERHFEVALTGSAREALILLSSGDYDVVLCDLLMPELSGMQLYEMVQAQNPSVAERFVFLTGGTTAAEARDFLRSVKNARAYKPIESTELIALVDRAARRVRQAASPH